VLKSMLCITYRFFPRAGGCWFCV